MGKKTLYKGGFKSFFKHKISVILVFIVTVISSLVFTVLSSTISNYKSSYNTLAEASNIHDYIYKENYKIDGATPTPKINPVTNSARKVYQFSDSDLVYVDKEKGPIVTIDMGIVNSPATGNEDSILFNLNNAASLPNSGNINALHDQFISYYPASSGAFNPLADVQFGFYQSSFIFMPSISLGNATFNYDSTNNIFTDIDFVGDGKIHTFSYGDPPSTYSSMKELGTKSAPIANTKFDATKSATWNLMNAMQPNEHIFDWTAPKINGFDKADIKQYLLDAINFATFKYRPANIGYKEIDVSDYQVTFDPANLQGDYLKTYNSDPTKYQKVISGIDTSQVNINNNTSSNPIVNEEKKNLVSKIINDTRTNKSINFDNSVQGIASKNNTPLLTSKVEGYSTSFDNKAFRVQNSDQFIKDGIDKLKIYNGELYEKNTFNDLAKPSTNGKSQVDNLKDSIINKYKGTKYTPVNFELSNNGWQYIYHYNIGPMPRRESIADPTAFQAVVSPQYAKENKLEPLSDISFMNSKEFSDAVSSINGTTSIINKYKNIYPKSFVDINGVTYFITGIGATLDTAYPIISNKKSIVDAKNEAILYVNKSGIARFKSSFPSADEESYIGLKFTSSSSDSDRDATIKEIETFAHSQMQFPDYVKIVSEARDGNEKIVMATQRTTFIENIFQNISLISWLSLTLLMLLTAIVIAISIRRLINAQKKTFAILQANGYTKSEIALSVIFPTVTVVGVSSLVGYLLGVFLQPAFQGIFSHFWTIPIDIIHFSYVPLLYTVIFSIFAVAIFAFVIVLLILSKNLLQNIYGTHSKFGSSISAKIINRMGWVGIKTKLAFSFIFTNIGKMVLVALSSVVAIVAIGFGVVNAGNYNYAVNETNKVNKYEYAIDLVSPTKEGGQYYATIPRDPSTIPANANYPMLDGDAPTRYWIGMTPTEKTVGTIQQGPHGVATDTADLNKYNVGHLISAYHSPGPLDAIAEKGTALGGWEIILARHPEAVENIINYNKGSVDTMLLLNSLQGTADSWTSGSAKDNPWEIGKLLYPSNLSYSMENSYLSSLYEMSQVQDNKKYSNTANLGFPQKPNTTSDENWYNLIIKMHEEDEKLNIIKELMHDSTKIISASYSALNTAHLYQKELNSSKPSNQKLDNYINDMNYYTNIKSEVTKLINKSDLDQANKDDLLSSLTFNSSWMNEIKNKYQNLTTHDIYEFIFSKWQSESDKTYDGLYSDSGLVRRFTASITTTASGGGNVLYTAFLDFLANAAKAQVYSVLSAYNQITMDVDDETYTSIRGNVKLTDIKGDNEDIAVSIKGIADNSQFIKIGNAEKTLRSYNGKNTPVVINKYMSKKYNLGTGSTFTMDINNSIDRYTNTSPHNQTFEVVDEINSFAGNQIVTLRSIANNLLGYDLKQGFNGVFTSHKNPEALVNTNLYSVTGIYPAYSSFNPSDPNSDASLILDKYLKSNINNLVDKNGNKITTISTFAQVYSSNFYTSSITDVQWSKTDQFIFKSVNSLSSNITLIIELVSILIAIIFMMILGFMLFDSNKKNASVLKVIGYRNREIMSAFIKSLIPSILIAIIISIPMLFAVVSIVQLSIMSFAAVYIPIPITAWAIITSIILTTTILVLVFIMSISQLRSQNVLDAFKE